jgi:hypothetical protein
MDKSANGLRAASFDLFVAAREAGEYEVAYHALCAALHAAESLHDDESCKEVQARAKECREWIDTRDPGHKLSTRSAQSRGHEGIFRQLEVTAGSARLRLELQKKQGRPEAPLAGSES